MIRSARKYAAIFKAQLTDRLAYPLDLITQSISILIFIFIFLQVWKTTYAATGQQVIEGFSLRDTIWYFMAAEMIMVSSPRVYRTISEAVKDGSIAYMLNKPYDFILYHASVGFGDLIARLIFNLLAGAAFTWLLVGPPPAPASIPLVLISYLLAWLINFCTSALIGLAAFVTEEVAPFDWIYNKLLLVAGGVLIPLDFFPDWLRQICQSLPFAYTIYGPARFFVDPSWQRFVTLTLGQLGWIAVFAGLLFLVYNRGKSWLNINGG